MAQQRRRKPKPGKSNIATNHPLGCALSSAYATSYFCVWIADERAARQTGDRVSDEVEILAEAQNFSLKLIVIDSKASLFVDFLRKSRLIASTTEEARNGRKQSGKRGAKRVSKIAR